MIILQFYDDRNYIQLLYYIELKFLEFFKKKDHLFAKTI